MREAQGILCNGEDCMPSAKRPFIGGRRFALSGFTYVLVFIVSFSIGLGFLASMTVRRSDAIPLSNRRLQLSKSTDLVLSETTGPRRLAICFFGLTRSLNITLPSIKQNLIGPIQRFGYDVDVFIHTYSDVAHLKNPRTGEDTDLNLNEWRLLNPNDAILTNQAAFLESVRYEKEECLRVGTGWPRERHERQRVNVENVLSQLNSIYEVGRLMEKHHTSRQYSAVMFARPDVHYSCPFPVEYLARLQPNVVYTPDWAKFNGINDRFALMTPSTATIWKLRKFFSLHECKKTPIHAERYVPIFLDAMGVKNSALRRFGFVRVRSNGEFSALDTQFTELCKDA